MYVALHNRSAYSFGTSLTGVADLAACAKAYGMPAVALTDVDGLYGAVAFQQACEAAGVRPILGAELVLGAAAAGGGGAGAVPVVLLAEDERGYGNLCRLVSLRHGRGECLGAADLCGHADGLACLIGRTEGERPAERMARLAGAAVVLREAFAGRLHIALAIHTGGDAAEARRRYRAAVELGVPVVATSESRCLRRGQGGILRALAAIGALAWLDGPHPDRPMGRWHLRSPAEMGRLFARCPEALSDTLAIAERCQFRLELGRNRFPSYALPGGESAIGRLRALCEAGCRRRYVEQLPPRGMGGRRPGLGEVLARLERELAVIDQVGYAEYFLVFEEIVAFCRRRGIATLARGSAADSLVCYALGVSGACPFRFDLPFDRFLNAERAQFSKMADIDLDLPWDRREEVVRWVFARWGGARAAMIGLPVTYRARGAVTALGRATGLPPSEVRRLARRLPWSARAGDWAEALRDGPSARGLPAGAEPYRTILQTAAALDGLPHHWAMHPCGLVVSPEPLTALVPVQPAPGGIRVSQYDAASLEALGFIKIDLLGQAGLSVLRDCVAEVERTEGVRVDMSSDVDYSDASTWEMIARGGARGVHHIESPAMTSLIRQCGCRDIDTLTAVVAVIRPGAANQGRKERFARRCQGFEPAGAVHPSLAEVLGPTYGLIVFEEQILQVAGAFAGLSAGRADVLRRALNKQDGGRIAAMAAEFRAGARGRGRSGVEIEAVWSMVAAFEGFMFNKAHSAQYAVEAFAGAWLKRRWPAHFLAAVLSNSRGFYAHSPTLPQILYVLEALRLGIGLKPPCVNRSGERFTVEYEGGRGGLVRRPALRAPLAHVRGLSERFIARWRDERGRGSFASLADFVGRCGPGAAEAQILLDSGALDGLCASRPAAFWALRRLRRGAESGGPPGSGRGQKDLELIGADRGGSAPPIALTEPGAREAARREMELIGFPVSVDPLTFLSRDERGGELDWSGYVPVGELGSFAGRRVTVCGLMVAERVNGSAGGGRMQFATLADRTGVVEAVLFPAAYRRFGHLTAAHPIWAATGVVEAFENGRGVTLRVERVSAPRWRASAAVGAGGVGGAGPVPAGAIAVQTRASS